MGRSQSRWTREQFETFLRDARVPIFVSPFLIVGCDCADIACHGWRLVAPAEATIGNGTRDRVLDRMGKRQR